MDDPEARARRKTELRTRVRAARRARSAEARRAAAAAIADHGARLVDALGARRVAMFLSTPSEPGTRTLLQRLEEDGVTVLLPRPLDGCALEWVPSGGGEQHHALGVPEPLGVVDQGGLSTCDLAFIPAGAATRAGARLGWGGGFYDRTLEATPPAGPIVAIVFADDLLDELPVEPHDAHVDGILTERGLVWSRATDGTSAR